ncbi:MAG: T9SS type A sorting domain-containing protein [Bacteroidetes bacterium]|nr:T9SS type A sorting domain-containing protein [Bacteroidota bacterium]
MKPFLLILAVLLAFAIPESQAQVLRSFGPRYYNPSVRGSIVYVANSIISTTGISTGNPGTAEPPPGGSTVNGAAGINLDVDNPAPTTKLAFGSTWNYFATGAAPANDGSGNTWKQSAYTLTGSWNTGGSPVNGAGKYGYNASQTTCIPSGITPVCSPGAGTKYTTYYYRNTVSFTATELSTTFYSIQMDLKRDDGIVVYINGVEQVRNNMPAGTISYSTLASSAIATGSAENVTVNLNPSAFTAGTNTIAVEVHLSSTSASDMSFDMDILGLDNNGTFNSTTADLNLSSCSTVLFAGLYWGAGQGGGGGNTGWITGETTCKLKVPGASSYTTITSGKTDYWNNTLISGYAHTGYQCFSDITSLVNTTSPNGTFTVANVLPPLGLNDAYGGWTIVIVYANPSLPPKNLTVFDGCAIVKSGSPPADVGISGFLTPPSGTVSCELGAVVYDGDRTSKDSFLFKQNGAAAFYNLTPNATANLNDMWNSTISYKGAVVTTRNPAYQNTIGYDADIIDLPNTLNAQLGNNKTSATVRFASPSENYIVHVLTTAISQYTPTFAIDKTATDVNGGTLVPGDVLRYVINYSNAGNDSSTNTIITDNIPTGTTFVPGSIKINGVAKTDASGDDQAEYDFTGNKIAFRLGVGATSSVGGNVGSGVSGTVQFDVTTTSSCDVLSCIGTIQNSARIDYNGKTSGAVLYDSSGVNSAGCITKGPVINTVTGSCFSPKDTVLVNQCNNFTVPLPYSKYAGYTFYSAMPFIPANVYNQFNPVSIPGVYYAHFSNGAGCSDTAKLTVKITGCPDIDDDNDGIPDYVEFNNPLALQDANSNGIPNWNDPTYPGYVDHNFDGVNDNFDYGADSDNDGIPNFYDTDFPGFVDANGDGVNDNADKDLDGIPNQYDLDSDNDGIPDVVESYGVDVDGDGIIDNYTDTDNDGFSQNVDANNTGVAGSSVGLGAQDFDGDGVPNYLDTDSDNDGIPDVVEAGGSDTNNDGRIDGFVDANSDGISDNDVSGTALMKTGPDIAPVDGRADSYPNKNLDMDFRPNAYDMDSDGDGIVDVIEAGLPDANLDGKVDGTIGTNGWSATISAMGTLNLRNTDGSGNPDYLDIDSDDDGIPDNIEGQSTAGYKLPGTTDTDGDGLVNTYDNVSGFGGSGIFVWDQDGDGIPDYRDLDTDGDGQPDIIEGNDFNLNGIADDNVSLMGLDTDGDGLDNRFDSLNSTTNIKGTSYRMGNSGSLTGDATPGTRAPVQKRTAGQTDRDWRFIGTVLPVQIINFSGTDQAAQIALQWTILATQEVDHFEVERSLDNTSYQNVATLATTVLLNQQQSFSAVDKTVYATDEIIYYRLKVVGKDGAIKYSNVLVIRRTQHQQVNIKPNPAKDYVTISFYTEKDGAVGIRLISELGKTVLQQQRNATRGMNSIVLNNLTVYGSGVYTLQVMLNNELVAKKLIVSR